MNTLETRNNTYQRPGISKATGESSTVTSEEVNVGKKEHDITADFRDAKVIQEWDNLVRDGAKSSEHLQLQEGAQVNSHDEEASDSGEEGVVERKNQESSTEDDEELYAIRAKRLAAEVKLLELQEKAMRAKKRSIKSRTPTPDLHRDTFNVNAQVFQPNERQRETSPKALGTAPRDSSKKVGTKRSSSSSTDSTELMCQFIARQSIATQLPKFDGNPTEWPSFIDTFRRTTALCKFTDEENVLRLQTCLQGEALRAVKCLLRFPKNLSKVLETLELEFGRSEAIIKAMIREVRALPNIKESSPKSIMELSLAVSNLVATLQSVKNVAHMRNPQLLEDLEGKLTSSMRLAWGSYVLSLPGEADIQDLAIWLKQKAAAARRFKHDEFKDNSDKDELKKKKANVLTTQKLTEQRCVCCDDDHKLTDCHKFRQWDVNRRKQLAKEKRLCFRCLKGKHIASKCTTRKTCKVANCGRRHHTLLHEATASKSKDSMSTVDTSSNVATENPVNTTENAKPSAQLTVARTGKMEILMRILPVTICGPKGSISTYAILDEGSSWTLVDKDLTKELGIRGKKEPLSMCWLNGAPKYENVHSVNLRVRGDGEEFRLKNVKAIGNLNLPLQSVQAANLQEKWTHLQGLTLPVLTSAKPRLLIGQDNIDLTVAREVREGPKNSPMATKTKLGWVIHGRNHFKGMVNGPVLFLSRAQRDEDLHHLVKQHFNMDVLGVKLGKPLESKDNQRAIAIAQATTRKVGNRWETGLLWKEDEVTLPSSFENAYNRLLSIEKKGSKDPTFKELYIKNMEDYVLKGYARKLQPKEVNTVNSKIWYLPHFGVVNPNKPGKLRIVFDAAAKSHGTSLNENLLSGPDLLTSLMSMLFKFRTHLVAFAADIKEMFPQIKIRKEDAVAQRFLWRSMDASKPCEVYQMDVMIFGASCSPYSAQEVRNRNAMELREQYPKAAEAIIRKHYMDDYLDSVATHDEARALINDVIHVHKSRGFELRNWISNSKEVLESIPKELQVTKRTIEDSSAVLIERVLGMLWDPAEDTFIYRVNEQKYKTLLTDSGLTKRKLLSMVMSLFDPLGLIADIIIKARIIIQDVWRTGIGWDDEVPSETRIKWENWVKDLLQVSSLAIPRCYQLSSKVNPELHIFCDASEQAYATVAYVRSSVEDGIQVNIIMSKSRVAPLKPVSIPRMELQAALIGSRLADFISKEHDFKFDKRFFWTDSRTVLSWLNSDARNFKQFVSNRVGEILELTDANEWRWCPTAVNVADEATRNAGTWNIEKSKWRKGPDFLKENESVWPVCEINQTMEELKPSYILLTQERTQELTQITPDVTRFSRFCRLLGATARMLQAVDIFKSKLKGKSKTDISLETVAKARRLLLQESQQRCFPNELCTLKQGKQVYKGSSIAMLSPYVDEDGLLRIEGRIDRASGASDTKRPIILHPRDELTRLIIDEYHVKSLHMGQERVVNELRQTYWILNIRSAVRSAWSRCLTCKAKRAQPRAPIMGQLPSARVNPTPHAFISTGIDYFGPILVTVKRTKEKRWGVLFTCMSTRAIHLELASSLTTDSCIQAIRRFSARRGQPLELWSDNGTNFRGADKELSEHLQNLNSSKMASELLYTGIKWHFNPPAAPHMGGCWERQIRSVKIGLSALLKERAPREETLLTFLSEVEAIVNSMPLTHVPLDSQDAEALTPSHFLIGRSCSLTPFRAPDSADQCLRKKWLLAQKMADEFWLRWRREYLPTLTRRTKWITDNGQVNIGDVVILIDENQPRGAWPKGITTNVYPGADGRTRVVDVKTKSGIFRRPVHKLCVLQVSQVEKDNPLRRGEC